MRYIPACPHRLIVWERVKERERNRKRQKERVPVVPSYQMRHPLQFAILMKIRHLHCKWSPLCRLQEKREREERESGVGEKQPVVPIGGGQRLWTYLVTVDLPHWVFRWLRWEKKGFLSFRAQGQGSSHILKECRDDVCCQGSPKTWLPPPPGKRTHTHIHAPLLQRELVPAQ